MTKRRRKWLRLSTHWLDLVGLFIFSVTVLVIIAALIKHFWTDR